MIYDTESRAFDAEILRVIDGWGSGGEAFGELEFDDLALRLFDYQMRYDRPYARYCASLGFSLGVLPNSWQGIPAVPAAAFKEAALATFDPSNAVLTFATSGTTGGHAGRHFFETPALYDAALQAAPQLPIVKPSASPQRPLRWSTFSIASNGARSASRSRRGRGSWKPAASKGAPAASSAKTCIEVFAIASGCSQTISLPNTG
jgi:hypothetical protein